MCKKAILKTCFVGFIFFVFFGFCCKRVVRPKQHRGNPLCILRVFVFFFSYKRTNEQGNPLCILRVFVFSAASKRIDEQVMCFVCFCVFSSDQWTHNQRAPCVFVFTYTLVIIPTRGKHLMCFVCFCVFYQHLVWSYFRPGQPPNVFYVFLCFSTKVSSHTTHVFRVFLYFINNI